jgi:hypothetical protein
MIETGGKGFHLGRSDVDAAWESSRDPDTPDRKRKAADDRQPESPPEIERKHEPNNWQREKHYRNHPDPMDTDSPASYPKHMMGPSDNVRYHRDVVPYQDLQNNVGGKLGTPILANEEGRGMNSGYGAPPPYRSNDYHNNYNFEGSQYQGHTPPRSHGHYLPEMDNSPHYGAPPSQPDVFMRPRRWACDYCNVATFVSYEEACAHEEGCARQYHERYGRPPPPSRGPVPQYERPHAPPPPPPHGGLGALYHASQEVGGRPPMWGSHGRPSMPTLGPHSHDGHHHNIHHQSPSHGYPPQHHQSPHHHQQHQHGYQSTPPSYGGYAGYDSRGAAPVRRDAYQNHLQKRMLLAMPTDSDSLSDRQCYVRSEMVEIFAASEKDVSARHSKGAQKLIKGQVGIRCVHCAHLRPRDRAERAVCYPSSISRIYQTVADMQRFHFEQCREIPNEIRKIYKSLKTTRPRGVGSPQTYWVQSAKLLDLADTEDGIRFNTEMKHEQEEVASATP